MTSYSITVNDRKMSVITPLSKSELIRQLKWKFGSDSKIEVRG